ncbi:radical SAM protein [Pontiella agarivorans]|uniref:Radical SAM protein n=1 Tax=Pontiella agarivorans TaxID=3038953 RepID=A0ABU5MVL8_9BACT|nr:radical SAM protein [Pontiella agarivorans]MDZ8118215.1 radical SAM protein [Pontiella agarivorans]
MQNSQVVKESGEGCADAGSRPGYIQPHALKELWFHTGTVCNLCCPFCLEGSRPGDDRLQQPSLADLKPFIEESLALGVQQFSFTGGEPFSNSEVIEVLDYALDRNPCLVLTNATEPLAGHLGRLAALIEKPFALQFRVSLDYPNPEKHDAGRGRGNFNLALKTMRQIHRLGFTVSIARQSAPNEDVDAVNRAYQPFFEEAGLPAETPIVVFPEFHEPGSHPDVPHITEHCMTTYKSAEERDRFMCSFSKMVVKKGGRMRVYACTLVDDDEDYDLGGSLHEAMEVRVMLQHHRCYTCFAAGASCSEL